MTDDGVPRNLRWSLRHWSLVISSDDPPFPPHEVENDALQRFARQQSKQRIGTSWDNFGKRQHAMRAIPQRTSPSSTLLKLATTAVDNTTPSKSLTNPVTLVQIALAVKSVPFEEIVGGIRGVDVHGDTVATGRDLGICFGDETRTGSSWGAVLPSAKCG